MSDTLQRFHEVLVREIRQNRPEYLDEPFTVAEIYQNLVPYRTHRDALGLEMNGDYEHVLLRLLGGEGDFLEIDSEVARRQIREELDHPNPNTGLFRDFAAADVRLTEAYRDVSDAIPDVGAYAPDVDGADDEELGDEDPDDEAPRRLFVMAGGDEDDEEGDEMDAEFEPEDPTVHAFGGDEDREEHSEESGTPAAHRHDEGESDDTCHWCRADLPERNVLNFCPFCGSDLGMKPCAECGEELNSGWMFCPSCGTEAAR